MCEDGHVELLHIDILTDPHHARQHGLLDQPVGVLFLGPDAEVELQHGHIVRDVVHAVLTHGLLWKARLELRVDLVHKSGTLLFGNLKHVC